MQSIKNRIWRAVIITVFVTSAVWILIFQTSNVFANLEASYIWAVPTFIGLHIPLHRKLNKIHNSVNNTKVGNDS